jgi:eukaryotic-like serine/threonine-protein kinase
MEPTATAPSKPDTKPGPSTRIGPYRLSSRLGAGGTAVVFRAQHEDTGQIVALKTVLEARAGHLASLRREILMLRRIAHRGIVRIFDGGSFEGKPWCAMELVEGRTFADLLAQSRQGSVTAASQTFTTETTDTSDPPYTDVSTPTGRQGGYPAAPRLASGERLEDFLKLVRMLCSPLAYLHGEGIVHRDVKPSNVFVRPDGTPVLMDFGLAWLLQEQQNRESLSSDAARAGTVAYMAPEQARGERVDARADLFSLGCMLYQAITGQLPFRDRTRRERSELDAKGLVPPSALAQDVPPALDDLVMRLLAPRPRDRVGHASDVAAVLEAEGAGDWPRASDPEPRQYLYRASISGRSSAVERLSTKVQELQAGKGSRVVVSGESGIGKTMVAAEIARLAEGGGVRVVTGECVAWSMEGGQGLRSGGPLYPFRKLLQAVADTVLSEGDEAYERLLGNRTKILAVCEPSLRQLPRASALPDPAELPAEANGQRLVEAFLDTLAALGRDRATLVVVDDLQWADDLSRTFIGNAPASFFEANRVMLLGTARSEELGPDIERLTSRPDVLHVVLGRLDEAALGAMAADMMGQRSVPQTLVSFLGRESQGNPFFAAEYMRAAVDAGMLLRDARGHWRHETAGADLTALALPHSLQDLVRRRLEALPADAQRLLELAALLGREFDPDVLGAIVGGISPITDAELVDQLADLTRRQILEETISASFRFTHDRLRTAADAAVPAERRPELHRHIGQVLETWHKEQATLDRAYGQLAHHFERGNELAKALRYSDLAGEQAHQTHAPHEALFHLERAKRIERELGLQTAPVDAARRERMLGLSSLNIGNVNDALAHLIEATRLLGNPWPSSKLALSRRLFSLLFNEIGRRFLGIGSSARQTPRPEAEREAMLEAARAYERLAVVSYFTTGDKNSVALAALGNLDLAEKAGGASAERCLGYASVGTMCSLVSLDKAALYYVSRAREVAQAARDRAAETWALINIALVHIQAGRWRQAREADEAARALATEIGFKRRWVEATIQLSSACYLAGEFDEAARLNNELATALDSNDRQARVWCATRKAELALVANEAEGALAVALEGVQECQGLGRPEWIYALGALALVYLRLGDSAKARQAADSCAEWIGKDTPIAYYNIEAYAWVAEVYFALLQERGGQQDEVNLRSAAVNAVRQVRAIGRTMPAAGPRAQLWRGFEALRLRGNKTDAEKHFRRSVAAAQRLTMPYDEAVALTSMVENLPLSAVELQTARETAAKLFSGLGAKHDLARLEGRA